MASHGRAVAGGVGKLSIRMALSALGDTTVQALQGPIGVISMVKAGRDPDSWLMTILALFPE